MPSYQVISDCTPGGEYKSQLEPQTLYVALHDRVKDSLGEFVCYTHKRIWQNTPLINPFSIGV